MLTFLKLYFLSDILLSFSKLHLNKMTKIVQALAWLCDL